MATRWIVPCNCEIIYDIDAQDNATVHSFTPCELHKNVTIENAFSEAIKYCKQIQGLEE